MDLMDLQVNTIILSISFVDRLESIHFVKLTIHFHKKLIQSTFLLTVPTNGTEYKYDRVFFQIYMER